MPQLVNRGPALNSRGSWGTASISRWTNIGAGVRMFGLYKLPPASSSFPTTTSAYAAGHFLYDRIPQRPPPHHLLSVMKLFGLLPILLSTAIASPIAVPRGLEFSDAVAQVAKRVDAKALHMSRDTLFEGRDGQAGRTVPHVARQTSDRVYETISTLEQASRDLSQIADNAEWSLHMFLDGGHADLDRIIGSLQWVPGALYEGINRLNGVDSGDTAVNSYSWGFNALVDATASFHAANGNLEAILAILWNVKEQQPEQSEHRNIIASRQSDVDGYLRERIGQGRDGFKSRMEEGLGNVETFIRFLRSSFASQTAGDREGNSIMSS